LLYLIFKVLLRLPLKFYHYSLRNVQDLLVKIASKPCTVNLSGFASTYFWGKKLQSLMG
jgi:hypothetical protein